MGFSILISFFGGLFHVLFFSDRLLVVFLVVTSCFGKLLVDFSIPTFFFGGVFDSDFFFDRLLVGF